MCKKLSKVNKGQMDKGIALVLNLKSENPIYKAHSKVQYGVQSSKSHYNHDGETNSCSAAMQFGTDNTVHEKHHVCSYKLMLWCQGSMGYTQNSLL